MKRRVARWEERGDLGNAEERIGVENEGDEELTGGEFRIVEGVPRVYVVFQSQRPHQIRSEPLRTWRLSAPQCGMSVPPRSS